MPSRPAPDRGAVREAPPPLPVRGAGQETQQPFREERGLRVSGNTLIAAQEEAGKARTTTEEAPKPQAGPASELSEADKERVKELQARDREVRAHEQAHARVGGQHAGSPQYEFERGPDGQSYAVGGSVSISTAPVPGDPAATVRKMEQVKRAALAPSEPSGQDRRVAADADAKRTDARAELAEISREEMKAQFEGEDKPDLPDGLEPAAKPDPAAPETLSETSPFSEQEDESAFAGGQKATAGENRDGEGTRNTVGFADADDAVEGVFGADATSAETDQSPFAQQIESFARTLERGIGAISGFAGSVGQLDIAPATQAEAQTTTRRTGVDIRV